MVVVGESETRDPGWTIEEAIRAVVSGEIVWTKGNNLSFRNDGGDPW